jgi:hypothetical protein
VALTLRISLLEICSTAKSYDFIPQFCRYPVFGRNFGQDTHTARSQTPIPPDQDCGIELLCHIKVRGEGNINLDVCNQSSPLVAKWRGAFFSTPQNFDICLFVVVYEREIGKTDWREAGRTEIIENLPANVRDLSFLKVIRTTFHHSRATELRFELWNSSFFGKKDHERIWTEAKLRGDLDADPLANMGHLVWRDLARQKMIAKKCAKGMMKGPKVEERAPMEAKLAAQLDGSNMVSERRQEVAAYFESDLPEKNTTIRLPQGILIAYSTCLLSDIMFARTKRYVPMEMKSILDRSTSICMLMAEGRSRIANAQYIQFEFQAHNFISPQSNTFHQAPNLFFMLFSEIDKKVTLQYVSELRPKSYSTRWWPFTMCVDRLFTKSIYDHGQPRLYAVVMHKPKTLYVKGVRQLDPAKSLSTFDIDLKKIETNEGDLIHYYSRKTKSGAPIDDDRSYHTLTAQLHDMRQKAFDASLTMSDDELDQRVEEIQQQIANSIADGTSASISVRMLRKKNASGNHKPLSTLSKSAYRDRATENDGTMLQELSDLPWLDATYTEQVRKALNFLNEQEDYWCGRTDFDDKEHAKKFFQTSPQTSPRIHPGTSPRRAAATSDVSAAATSDVSVQERRVPKLRLDASAPQSALQQSTGAAASSMMRLLHNPGSQSSRSSESHRLLKEGVSKAFFWLHRASAVAAPRIIGGRVISGTLVDDGPLLKACTLPKTALSSGFHHTQSPRQQLASARGIASYLTNKCGIDMTSPTKAAEYQAVPGSQTARRSAATGSTAADVVLPTPPSAANHKNQLNSPLLQLRQRSRID